MTATKKVLAALLPLGLGVTLVALAQSTNTSAPQGTTIVEKTQAGPAVGQAGQVNRDLNTPQNVGASSPEQVAQTQTPIQSEPPATTASPAPSPAASPQSSGAMDNPTSSSTATAGEKGGASSYGTAPRAEESTSAATTSSQKLPKTASDLPLAALAGALALGAGLGLRSLRR